MSLIHQGKVDAVFGWNAFRTIWPNTCETVELPPDLQVYRSTVVGLLACTQNPKLAKQFIDFLISDEMKKIYSDLEWIHKQ